MSDDISTKLRERFMAMVGHPIDECGYEGGCLQARALDALIAHTAAQARASMPCYENHARPDGKYSCEWFIEQRSGTGIVEEPKRCESCEARIDLAAIKREVGGAG